MDGCKKVKIKDICRIIKGKTSISDAAKGEYPLITTAKEYKTSAAYQFDCEAVCIPLVSSGGNGKKVINNLHYQNGKFALATIMCALIPHNTTEVSIPFLYFYLQFYKNTLLIPLMKGSYNVYLAMKDIANVELYLPDIKTQQQTAVLMSTVQNIEQQLNNEAENQADYIKQIKQSIIQAAIEGKLTSTWRKNHPVIKDNPDFDASFLLEKLIKEKEKLIEKKQLLKKKPTKAFYDAASYPFSIPESWCWAQLSEVSVLQEGAGIRKYQYAKDGIQLLCVTNILDDKIDLDLKRLCISSDEYYEKYKQFTLNKGDIVTSCSGNSWGKISIFESEDTVMLNTSTMRLRFFGDLAVNSYLYFLMKSNFVHKQLETQISGMQPNLGYAHYSKIVIPLPPQEEQKQIVELITIAMEKCSELEKQLEAQQKYIKCLISDFTNKTLEKYKV